jgi:hypothetical protein
VSEHQETITQVLRRAVASFDKMDAYGKKLDDHRITLGVLLNDLRARVDAGEAGKGVKWWSWYGEHFPDRSRRDAERVMKLASSDDPQAAADEERTKAREGMAAHRKKIATNVSRASHGSDLPNDAAADESAAQWADEMFLRVEQDIKEEDIDLWLGLHALYRRMGDQIGELGRQRAAALAPPTEPAKKRGRLSGSKNKPKEAEPAPEESPKPAPTGNAADVDDSASAMKAKMAALDGDDGSIPGFLRRDPPEQAVQP